MKVELIGWASSLILLLTLTKQVYKQWQSGTVEGVVIYFRNRVRRPSATCRHPTPT